MSPAYSNSQSREEGGRISTIYELILFNIESIVFEFGPDDWYGLS